MDHRHFRNKVEDFHEFLTEVCGEFKEKCESDDSVPVRLANPRITPQELEGECLDWCRDFLSTRGCPLSLQALISHEVYEQLSSSSLEIFSTEDNKNDSPRIVTNKSENVDNIDDNKKKDSDKENVEYSAEKLHSHVNSLLQSLCEAWLANMPEIRIDGSLPVVSFHAIKNTRRKMEDKHVIVPDLNALFGLKDHPPESFYAVFDGHAGIEAALFSSKQFHCNLVHNCDLGKDPAAASKSAFKITDEQFIPKAKREKWRSGTTGVTALVRGTKLYLSWLGDSQAVLVRNGKAVVDMEPHKPDRQDERDRIEAAGGFVVLMGDLWRVGGNLAVSRAIGDVVYKPFISSDAEVLEIEMDGTEDYMVLACDGLWDAVTSKELPQLVFNYLRDDNNDRHGVARYLVQYAKENESMDNISVIVVFFRENIGEPVADAGFFNFFAGGDTQGSNESGDNNDKSKGGNSPNSGMGDNSNWQHGGSDGKGGNSGIADNADGGETNDIEHNEEMVRETSGLQPTDLVDLEITDSFRSEGNDFNNAQYEKENSKMLCTESPRVNKMLEKGVSLPVVDDLDRYGVFNTRLVDGPIDLSFVVDNNSSVLLRDIADSLYNQTQRTSERTGLSMSSQVKLTPKSTGHRKTSQEDLDFSNYFNLDTKTAKKKLKKINTERLRSTREKSRKGRSKSPVVWAFTGNNKASVQNHRLNLTMKGVKSKPTPGELTLADKAPPRLDEKSSNKFAQQYSSSENVHEIANMTLNHGKLESLRPRKSKLSSRSLSNVPGLTIFGSKANLQTESEKFLTTLRPRKPLKPITSVVYDSPPSPFISNKLSVPRHP